MGKRNKKRKRAFDIRGRFYALGVWRGRVTFFLGTPKVRHEVRKAGRDILRCEQCSSRNCLRFLCADEEERLAFYYDRKYCGTFDPLTQCRYGEIALGCW